MSRLQELAGAATPVAEDFPGCAITDLSHFGLIRVAGADSRTFLQGQVTNDVNQVSATQAQVNSYCSPKGRMLGSFWLFERDDDLYLQLPADRLAPTLQRIGMFVLRSQVELSDASETLLRFGLTGDCAAQLLEDPPQQPWATATHADVTTMRLPGDRPRFEFVGPADAITALWTRLLEDAVPTGPDFWSLMDIRAGLPTVYEDTAEAFVPQMANLQLVGGVNFKKGCYTGQEVVARMQYLGKLKRRMYRAKIEADMAPTPGTEIFSPDSESGQGAGRIVDAAVSPDGGFEALVVLQISSAESSELHLRDADGPRLQLLSLPYRFETPED